ncbi:phospholipase D2-like isoform X2 [Leptotrombidium deliense]|uniref:Phospholipase n=1 Tax=Leptotrombidium deliense TaxID=299467 RepID=A0A443SVX8_9ACAR|nr:phospholipase D2-like isoform X2 [Leptotrombidium deliense]
MRVQIYFFSYLIEVRHGDYLWTVKRRYNHFLSLHQQLRLYRASLNVPLPLKRHQERRRSLEKSDKHLPRFPRKPDALVSTEDVHKRAKQLQDYLQLTLTVEMFRKHHSLLNFLEICHLSFIDELGHKGMEGLVRKKSGGDMRGNICRRLKNNCLSIFGHWRKRWLIAKDSCILYIRPKDGKIKAVLLMDEHFEVIVYSNTHIRISNLSGNLVLQCWTNRKANEWTEYLNDIAHTLGKDFTESHRYGSFAPIRRNSKMFWFVDGQSYMEAVAEALEKAQHEVFITDWWFSPEVYMKRPVIHGDLWRLDKILERIAKRGVKVFVLLYKEVELALGIKSLYSKKQLMRLHPNIKVLRHPDTIGGVLLWSHHEKLVIIDQSYAFVGGIDLCYGRWDNYDHKLTDLGGITHSKSEGSEMKISVNDVPEMKDLQDIPADVKHSADGLQDSQQTNTNKLLKTNEKVHEIKSTKSVFKRAALKVMNKSEATSNSNSNENESSRIAASNVHPKLKAQRLFQVVAVSRKLNIYVLVLHYFLMKRINTLRRLTRHRSKDSFSSDEDNEAFDRMRKSADIGFEGGAKLWFGKDYANFIAKDFSQLDQPYQDLVDRYTTPRMPWHDIATMVQGSAARDVARHFIQRWNQTKYEKAKYHDKYNWLLPRSYKTINRIRNFKFLSKGYNVDCQVVRSVSAWSAGVKVTECSIHKAYVDAIHNSRHYVYIENQFFVTQTAGKVSSKDCSVLNEIGEALYWRIVRAFRNNETFRVFVIIPLLPAFEGELGTTKGTALQAVTHWNMSSICRGSDSLLQRLQCEVGDPRKYISFFGLRNYDELNGKLVTELIYVHSKLIIIDDKTCIIGSSNINDRSLIGSRDSEVALVVNDLEFSESLMNGQLYQSGRFSGSLRRFLFREHLGLLDAVNCKIDIRDPVCDKFYKDVWLSTAAKNTSVFESVFGTIPSDNVHTFAQLRDHQKNQWLVNTDEEEARKMVRNIKGHIVLFPLLFLKDENLQPSSGTKESLMPSTIWT